MGTNENQTTQVEGQARHRLDAAAGETRQVRVNAAAIRQLLASGMSIAGIGRHFGCCEQTVRAHMDRAGIARNRGRTPRKHDPTPDEIAVLAAECLARRTESPPESQWEPPHLTWDGQAFRVLG